MVFNKVIPKDSIEIVYNCKGKRKRKEKIGIHPGFLFGFYKNNIGNMH
jgi:hypothetical protein